MRLINATGQPLNAELSLKESGGGITLTIESRSGARGSGRARNPDYDAALTLAFERLGQIDATITDAQVVSDAALTNYSDPNERRLRIGESYPILLSGRDSDALRRAFGRAQRKTARDPALSSSGNNTKRVSFWLGIALR